MHTIHLPEPGQRPLVYPIDEAARLLAISRTTIYKLIDQQKLTKVIIAGRSCITAASIQHLYQTAVAEVEAGLKDDPRQLELFELATTGDN
jgi:excisionase family DNA binding protein